MPRRDILAQLRASGLTQREFAKREGVALSKLTYWIRKERLEQTREKRQPKTALVAVAEPGRTAGRFLVEVDGVRIEVPRDVTVEEWRRFQESWAS